MKNAMRAAALTLMVAASGAVLAQYAGPSSIPKTTVKELLDTGKDDQKAILVGRIVSHDGDDHYTFDDGTGRIRVEISSRRFPQGQPIDDKQQVELTGELDKDRNDVEFDVDKLRVM
ncbi:NirD/YgiW/YdeI family stress tolerance protein [Orrella sp. JC864]|uniref:YgiW/YdeI family stress tolerance OB fold protein n=1 Tax=Orrella sp. JC864 TaxID=3120298 RepID=UPI0012BB7811